MSADKNPLMNIEQARDLLSAYLDDEVTTEERVLVEQALTDSPDLHRELEMLRRTLVLLSSLPPVAAPRPFTLREADVRPNAPAPKPSAGGLPAWAVGWVGLAAALLCVLAGGGLFWNMRFGAMPAAAPAAQIALAPTSLPSAIQAESAAPAEAAAQKIGPETVIQQATPPALPTEVVAPPIMAEPITPPMAAPAEAPKLEIAEAEGEAAQAEVPAGDSADSATIGESAPMPSALPAQDEALTAAASTESPPAEAYLAETAPAPPTESPSSLALTAPRPDEAANAAGAQMKQSAESAPNQPAAAQERSEVSPSPEVLPPLPLSPLVTPTPLPSAAPTLLPASTPVARLTFEAPATPMPAIEATPTPIPTPDTVPFAWSWLIGGVIMILLIVGGLAWWMSQKRRLP